MGDSYHSCKCNNNKTGLILYYPKEYKNVCLLMCESCYGYKYNNGT